MHPKNIDPPASRRPAAASASRLFQLLTAAALAAALAGCVVDETDVVIRPDGSGYVRRIVTPTQPYQASFARKYDRVVGYRTLAQEAEAERSRWGRALTLDRVEVVRDDGGEATRLIAQFGFKNVNEIVICVPALEGEVQVTPSFAGQRLDLRYPPDPSRQRPRESELRERERSYLGQYRAYEEAFADARRRLSLFFPRGTRSTDASHVDQAGRRITLYDVAPGRILRRGAERGGWLRQLLLAPARKDRAALLADVPGTRIETRGDITVALQD